MLRDKLIKKGNQKEPEFCWRSDKVTRLEGFSDAVLAFAMTLLVVSLEVSKTFDQLMVATEVHLYLIWIFSICLAAVDKLLGVPVFGALSGWIYALIGPSIAIHATRMAKAREKMA